MDIIWEVVMGIDIRIGCVVETKIGMDIEVEIGITIGIEESWLTCISCVVWIDFHNWIFGDNYGCSSMMV